MSTSSDIYNHLSEPLIDVRGVGKCYEFYDRPADRFLQIFFKDKKSFSKRFWAVKPISLQIHKGESVALIGRNGAGKSTLLQLIVGTLKPTTGEVVVRGKVAALLQLGSGFNPEFSGRENVYLNGAVLGFTRREIQEKFDEILDFSGVEEFIDQPVKSYSSGMAMRLAFAVSICLEPEILIVDEALSVGDAHFQFKCRARLELMLDNGATLLFVSHDMEMVKSFCTRAIYIEKGMVKVEGLPHDVIEEYYFDVRAEQSATFASQSNNHSWKLEQLDNRAFKNSFGTILKYNFLNVDNPIAYINYGDVIELVIECAVSTQLNSPYLSVIVQSQNMMHIGGEAVALKDSNDQNLSAGVQQINKVKIKFIAYLNTGEYFVSLRLEERESLRSKTFNPIHKISGALSFHVENHTKQALLGICDLGLSSKVEKLNDFS